MASKPKTIQILGTEFRIEYTTKLPKDDYGDTVGNDRVIRVKSRLRGEIAKSTLIHEILHAIFHVSGQSEILAKHDESGQLEEALVVALEHGLTPIISLDNSGKE